MTWCIRRTRMSSWMLAARLRCECSCSAVGRELPCAVAPPQAASGTRYAPQERGTFCIRCTEYALGPHAAMENCVPCVCCRVCVVMHVNVAFGSSCRCTNSSACERGKCAASPQGGAAGMSIFRRAFEPAPRIPVHSEMFTECGGMRGIKSFVLLHILPFHLGPYYSCTLAANLLRKVRS